MKCEPTRAARGLFVRGTELHYVRQSESGHVRLESVEERERGLVLSLEGVNDRNAAERFIGATFYVPREAIELEAHEYLDEDLTGCVVTGLGGQTYGSVERIEHYPSSDMLVVAGSMVPMVSAIVLNIDVEKKQILIDPPEGLFPS